MMANCSRFSGEESTLAPTSMRMVALPDTVVGKTAASAGRSTPGSARRPIFAVAVADRLRARTRREENLRFRGRRFGATTAPQKLFFGFNVQDFAPLIVAAFGAGTMRHLAFVAIRALGKRMRGQKIVGAAA